jgi:hypothetical protein
MPSNWRSKEFLDTTTGQRCRYLFGYDIYTAPVEVGGIADKTTKIKFRKEFIGISEPPISKSMGPVLTGLAPLKPASSIYNAHASLSKRVGREFLPTNPALMQEFADFSRKFIRERFQHIIPRTEMFDFEEWLVTTPYNQNKKDQLRKLRQNNLHVFHRIFCDQMKKLGSFTKDESYPEFKPSRFINARKDAAKIVLGPIVKKIEALAYEHYSFIKHTPVTERVDKIISVLGTKGPFYVSDYSAFESLFTRELFETCEMPFYEHMLSEHPDRDNIMQLFRSIMLGKNNMVSKHANMIVNNRRMSGEMNTSLGNGITNLLILSFIAHKSGVDIKMFVEGDDGIMSTSGPLREELFAQIGIRAKIQRHDQLGTTSFCGILFDPECRQQITDPRAAIINFAWTKKTHLHSKQSTLKALLKAKAMSFIYQAPACPCLTEYCRMILRNTRNVSVHRVIEHERNQWMYDWYQQILTAHPEIVQNKWYDQTEEIKYGTRLLVEQLFHIPVSQQLAFEHYMRHKNDLLPIEGHLFPSLETPQNWLMYDNFTLSLPARLTSQQMSTVHFRIAPYNTDWEI